MSAQEEEGKLRVAAALRAPAHLLRFFDEKHF
jgi:hypothetical protein